MKAIFLDIDGVLNSRESIVRAKECYGKSCVADYRAWDKIAIDALKYIIVMTNARIIISSSWRHNMWHTCWCLGRVNLPLPIAKIRKYPAFEDRGDLIKEYLNLHNTSITNYVVLDDDSTIKNKLDNFVCIDSRMGLTKENAKQAIKILNKLQNSNHNIGAENGC